MHVCKLRPLGQFSQGLVLSVSDPELDQDSIGPVDADSDSKSGSGYRRAKMTNKSRKN